jgi:glycosyltransferase involved in cell wall biosynthesis
MRILVCLPTYQRVQFLPRGIESVQSQTHRDWQLLVVDDGSTDGTQELVARYARGDSRIMYSRSSSNENRGGVAANEVGMHTAISGSFDAWTRLGSDDWFLPRKLELDALALQDAGACFGPYRNDPETYGGELNVPMDARAALLRGEFAASWANIAMRTEVLAAVHARHGNFVDPRLRNMEDYLFCVRAARFTEFVWRGITVDGRIVIGARESSSHWWTPDARYTIGSDPVCCSNSAEGQRWGAKDAVLTEQIRGEDAAKNYPVAEIAPPALRIIG